MSTQPFGNVLGPYALRMGWTFAAKQFGFEVKIAFCPGKYCSSSYFFHSENLFRTRSQTSPGSGICLGQRQDGTVKCRIALFAAGDKTHVFQRNPAVAKRKELVSHGHARHPTFALHA